MSQSKLRWIAEETESICAAGWYQLADSARVQIEDTLAKSIAETVYHKAGSAISVTTSASASSSSSSASTAKRATIVFAEQTTFGAAWGYRNQDVAVLNFASAKNPGGGWLNGRVAQEECLARDSTLVAALNSKQGHKFYATTHADASYSDDVIWSPHVSVIRDEQSALIKPWTVAVLTCAWPNLKGLRGHRRVPTEAMLELANQASCRRSMRVMELAAAHGHRVLVIGAAGTGVFENPVESVGAAFADAFLAHETSFTTVVCAIPDAKKLRAFQAAFETRCAEIQAQRDASATASTKKSASAAQSDMETVVAWFFEPGMDAPESFPLSAAKLKSKKNQTPRCVSGCIHAPPWKLSTDLKSAPAIVAAFFKHDRVLERTVLSVKGSVLVIRLSEKDESSSSSSSSAATASKTALFFTERKKDGEPVGTEFDTLTALNITTF